MDTPAITLRPPRRSDADVLFEWINNRQLVVLSAPFKAVARAEHDRWFERVLAREGPDAFFIIEELTGHRAIGSCQLVNIHPVHRSAELRIRIGAGDATGRGLGTLAVRLLTEYGFQELGLHRISLQVLTTNLQARKAYKKSGFTEEGRMKDAACIDGRFVDVIIMGLVDEAR